MTADESRGIDGGGFAVTRREGVVRLRRARTEWLSSGPNGGRRIAPAAYNISVPDGWPHTDLDAYVADRLECAGFSESGPALLTGVEMDDVRGARCGSVTAVVTAGISNPAVLPMDPTDGPLPDEPESTDTGRGEDTPVGTVNILVGTTRNLADGALANLLAVATEAKTATLLEATGFPGTTTDAIVVGHDPQGRRTAFSGSGTRVGAATRACVRDALLASLRAHYGSIAVDGYVGGSPATDESNGDGRAATSSADPNGRSSTHSSDDTSLPSSLRDADYGLSTDVVATVFRPSTND